jgi:hypothetical protein
MRVDSPGLVSELRHFDDFEAGTFEQLCALAVDDEQASDCLAVSLGEP